MGDFGDGAKSMRPTRAGKAGALIGTAGGLAAGTWLGLRKVRADAEGGPVQWNRRTALIIGGYALGGAALGGLAGLGLGEGGDYLFAEDGRKAMKKAVETARAQAEKLGLDPEAT